MNVKNVILEKSFEFALKVIEFTEQLEERQKYVIARQLLRSGKSIGANVREAQSAESRVDFIHKLKISDKEANEVSYWLKLCKFSRNYPDSDELENQLIEIQKRLSAIISSSKRNNKKLTH